ncbi:MAG: hypothetical protein H7643_07385, partial [Candidatus Heimdallarchaeota archaeon]|nr:hypothetical protein [Candidatus Heimdallarchaeota archaeon]
MRSNKKLILIINTFFIALLMMSASPAQADAYGTQAEEIENAENFYPHYYEFPKKIAVVVDPTDPLVYSTAYSVYKSILPIIGTTELITVTSFTKLDEITKNNDYWVYIYFFASDMETVHIGSGKATWGQFAAFISQSSTFTEHIIGFGNSRSLKQYLGAPRFHMEGSDVIDANVAFLYALWELAEIMEPKEEPYHSAGMDFRTLAIKYYFQNFDVIFERNMDPKDPLGEEDLEAKQENYDRLISEQPAYIEPKIIHINPDGTEEEYILDEKGDPIGYEGTEELKPVLSIMPTPPADSPLSDFIVGVLPLSSGMQGPIGGIVDTLLEFLIDEMGNQLGLDEGTGELIANAMEMIELVVGIAKDPSPSSAIKGIIDLIKGQFPFLQEYDKYFDLIVDALFALRGEASDITGLITSALKLLLPESLTDVIDPVMNILKMGPELVDVLTSGDKIFENLLTLFSGGMVESLLEMLMKEIADDVGFDESNAEDYAQKINSFIKCMIGMISSFDPSKIITEYIPEIMTAFGLTVASDTLQQVLGLVNFGFTALGMGTGNIKDILEDYLQLVIGALGAEDAVNAAKSLVEKINNAISAKSTDVSGLRTELETVLTSIPGISTELRAFLLDLLTMIGGFMNPEFPKGEIPALMTGLLPQALTLFGVESGVQDIITKSIKAIMGIIAFFKDNKSLKEMLYGSVNNFLSNLGNSPEEIIMTIVDFVMNSKTIPSGVQAIIDGSIGIITGVISLITNQGEFSIQSILQTVLQAVGLGLFQYMSDDIEAAGGDPQALMASFTQ